MKQIVTYQEWVNSLQVRTVSVEIMLSIAPRILEIQAILTVLVLQINDKKVHSLFEETIIDINKALHLFKFSMGS